MAAIQRKTDRNMLIKELIEETDEEFDDEGMLHALIGQKMTANINAHDEKVSFGQHAADAVAKFAGSWGFIGSFLLVMAVWMTINVLMATEAFDAYPFILLNLLLSCIAAVQAPLIMMSQNRQEEKDRTRAENDYHVNLKNELVLDDLHEKLDALLENQAKLMGEIEQLKREQK